MLKKSSVFEVVYCTQRGLENLEMYCPEFGIFILTLDSFAIASSAECVLDYGYAGCKLGPMMIVL